MGQSNPDYSNILDDMLVQALQPLSFNHEALQFIEEHPYGSNYRDLVRRMMHILFIKPELRTSPEAESFRIVLFHCLNQVTEQEFNSAIQDLTKYYLSNTSKIKFNKNILLDSPQVPLPPMLLASEGLNHKPGY